MRCDYPNHRTVLSGFSIVPTDVLEDALAILNGNVEDKREAFNSGAEARIVSALTYALEREANELTHDQAAERWQRFLNETAGE